MNSKDIRKRLEAAYSLLQSETTTREQFESIRTLVKGINPRIDEVLATSAKTLSDLEKLQKGEVIELTAAHLPERTETEKKRKKAILLFITHWKELKGEVQRVKSEFAQMQQTPEDKEGTLRILAKMKGPLGIVTIAAVVTVGVSFLFGTNKENEPSRKDPPQTILKQGEAGKTIKVIHFNGKQVPLTELRVGDGPDCGRGNIPHYHALNGASVTTTDSAVVPDPGACGYGKVADTRVEEIEQK